MLVPVLVPVLVVVALEEENVAGLLFFTARPVKAASTKVLALTAALLRHIKASKDSAFDGIILLLCDLDLRRGRVLLLY